MAGTILTRRKLYDLVWSQPISKLAVEFNMSGRGLAKVCARHQIPTPPRAYWAKLLAGRAEVPPPLSEVDDPDIERVTVDAASAHQRGAAKRARSKVRAPPKPPTQLETRLADYRTEVERQKLAKALPRRGKAVWFVVQVKDWSWDYEFGLARPDPKGRAPSPDEPSKRYWEFNSLSLTAAVMKPQRFRGRRLIAELRATPEMRWDDRDYHTTQCIGELWSSGGAFSANVMIPFHVFGHLMQALGLGLSKIIVLETTGVLGKSTNIMDVSFKSSIDEGDYDG